MIPSKNVTQLKMRRDSCWPGTATLAVTIFAVLLLSRPGFAETDARLSGFGSVGAGRVLTDGGMFAGYDDHWSYDTDSVVGLQADVTASGGLSFTTQIVARGYDFQDTEARYDPAIELMFLAYQVGDDLRLRGGLLRTPFYIYSDSVEVGYAYPWVRPPIDVYTTLSQTITHMKGVDATLYKAWGDALVEWRLAYGYHNTHFETSVTEYDLNLDPLFGSTLTLNWEDMLFRYSVYRATYSFADERLAFVEGYYRNLASIDPLFDDLANNVSGEAVVNYYHVLGFQYEKDNWLITSEANYSAAPGEKFSIGLSGIYFSVARQMGRFFPYVLTSYFETHASDYMYRQLEESERINVPEDKRDFLNVIRQGTRQAFDTVDYYNTRAAVGVRYDINENLDVKSEIEYYALESYTNSEQLPTDQVMLTFVLDWVF